MKNIEKFKVTQYTTKPNLRTLGRSELDKMCLNVIRTGHKMDFKSHMRVVNWNFNIYYQPYIY